MTEEICFAQLVWSVEENMASECFLRVASFASVLNLLVVPILSKQNMLLNQNQGCVLFVNFCQAGAAAAAWACLRGVAGRGEQPTLRSLHCDAVPLSCFELPAACVLSHVPVYLIILSTLSKGYLE